MTVKKITYLFILFTCVVGYAQTNNIFINAQLSIKNHEINIEQTITYFNNSNSTLDTIYLHNWANAYKNKKSLLAKRLLENYDKSLYFAKAEKRGFSTIKYLNCNAIPANFEELPKANDILKVLLPNSLKPGDSVTIDIAYLVKIPIDKFTRYGYDDNNFNLRYWYITPAVYDGKWNLMSNLDMDDLYMDLTNYKIKFTLPYGYTLNSDLSEKVKLKDDTVVYNLSDKKRTDIEINIQLKHDFSNYKLENIDIVSNLKSNELTENVKTDVLNRQLYFIEEYLGKYTHKKLLINKTTYSKNPVYGFNQLPKFLTPFSNVFEWDIKMFKALTSRFIENTILVNKREDVWLADGIQIYLMILYVNRFYPEVRAVGDISKIWGISRYTLSKLKFNDKYPFVYQFSARKNLDQPLTTRSDSLSNFNRKIVNKYKSGLGLQYLDNYLNDSILKNSLKQFYQINNSKLSKSKSFEGILKSNTNKNLNWFFGDYLQTTNKIDYTIDEIEKKDDSIKVTIKNLSNFTTPIALYGAKRKHIIYKHWIDGIDSVKTVTVSNKKIDRLALNYEYLYPEINLRNNWKKIDKKLFNRPLKFTFFKDVEDPYYNQMFYNLFFQYNFYDGLILGPQIYNQAAIKKKWLFKVTPKYGFKSKVFTGSASFAFQHLPQFSSVYKYRAGIAASNSHYNEGLTYNKFTPFIQVDFKRKTLRDVGGKSILARFVVVDKELPLEPVNPETLKYNILNLRYAFFKPDLLNDLRYYADFQYAGNFSKISLDLRYRKLTDNNRQYDFRLFFGGFLHNKTESDFFSFALDRPTDYLFDYTYLGRSEDSGFFSQQIIISEGGFKSIFDSQFANQWMLSTNASVSLWRWVELYADAGLIKNRDNSAIFRYDTGIRLNFIHNFLEFYFPIQSSLGFEPSLPNYASRIRFVFTFDPSRVYKFIKRGFY